ncbi:diguanylate cyclase domain-containing protein [Gluconacetobacter sp. Hr-1-5]|uniref:ligand-binding sensor domain-containing diguanylate cyclase n=1 Tax=Gluconacetobacter sp. Hr-1-5 TaxID=3395370 RepID=UPI003B51FC12
MHGPPEKKRRSLFRRRKIPAWLAFLPCFAVFLAAMSPAVHGQTIPTTLYDATSGLSNISVISAIELPTGQILVVTQHGFFFFDGRRFLPAGPSQGLPAAGVGVAAAVTGEGDLVLAYADMIYVAYNIAATTSPDQLHFLPIDCGHPLGHDSRRKIMPWHGGLVVTDRDRLLFIHKDAAGEHISLLATMLAMHGDPLTDVSALGADGDTLWIGTIDGRLCTVSGPDLHCRSLPPMAEPRRLEAILQDRDGTVFARTLHELVVVPRGDTAPHVETIPHADRQYENYQHLLTMSWSPQGALVTQADNDELAIRTDGNWKTVTLGGEQSNSPLTALLFDNQENLWIGRMGYGLARTTGFGIFETFTRRDGLASDVIWQMARQPAGPLWIDTDTGISALDTRTNTVVRTIGEAGLHVATDRRGILWQAGPEGVSLHDTQSTWRRDLAIKRVNQILIGSGDDVWLLSDHGAWLADASRRDQDPVPVPGLTGSYVRGQIDATGTLWLLERRRLVARHPDGTTTVVMPQWPLSTFAPYVIDLQDDHRLWIGGQGGIYRLTHDGDRIDDVTFYDAATVGNAILYSLIIDRKGRVWAGSDRGLNVFDGRRWITITEADGLVSNDLDQDSLLEDTDGSLWIGTSRGLSHLLRPDALLADISPQPVITAIELGQHPYHGEPIAFSRAPMRVMFGTLDYRDAPHIRFRYRLEGADEGWTETTEGSVRYPSVPPGTHRFMLVAFDPDRHQQSAVVTATITMAYPWWQRWPVLCLEAACVLLAGYMAWRIRVGLLIKQRRKLQTIVERQTREIRATHQALIEQSRLDSLTGLLNRGAIQSLLQSSLAELPADTPLMAALIDVDHFKQINDGWGHLIGDEVLAGLGGRLRQGMTQGDAAGRYGGEEFLVVLTGESATAAHMEALCRSLSDLPTLVGTPELVVTVSAGIAMAAANETWQSLIARADKALYRAKAEGRNRVVQAR